MQHASWHEKCAIFTGQSVKSGRRHLIHEMCSFGTDCPSRNPKQIIFNWDHLGRDHLVKMVTVPVTVKYVVFWKENCSVLKCFVSQKLGVLSLWWIQETRTFGNTAIVWKNAYQTVMKMYLMACICATWVRSRLGLSYLIQSWERNVFSSHLT